MSLSEANAFDRAVTAGRLRCPPGLAELAEFDDTDHVSTETDTPASQATQTIAAPDFGHLYGRSPVMRALYSQIAKVSNTLATVLIMGEAGTGKELIASPSCSATKRAALPAQRSAISAISSTPAAAPSSWTRSPRCRWRCR